MLAHSRGYFTGDNSRRRDWLGRSSLGLWVKLAEGFQLGPFYEFWNRRSTAESYAFMDQRVLGRVIWSYDTDRYSVTGESGRARMDWLRSGAARNRDNARIQELLRQDEVVKQGSSCLK